MSATAPPADPDRRFGVVIPVKQAAVAKSRLRPLGDEARRALVAAFAVDTVQAALECRLVQRVLVVTDDVSLARHLGELGADAVPDGESDSLNATLRQGAAELVRRTPDLRPVALCADLPALEPEQLATALVAAGTSPSAFVPDAAGVGTTMYAASSLDGFRPRFGRASRAAHLAAGSSELDVAGITTLRCDVDTPSDLRAAADLGLGTRTSWVVTSLGLLDR